MDLSEYYRDHEKRYAENIIRTKAREDAAREIPHADGEEPSPFEMELVHACAKLASKIAGDYKSELEKLDATSKAERDQVERAYHDAVDHAEKIYEAKKSALDSSQLETDARKRFELAQNRYQSMFTKYGRAPLEYVPHWLYVVLATLIFLGEIPLNAIVFQIFGEAQIMTWIMAFVIGLAIPLCAHFVGIKVREHEGNLSLPNALKGLVVFLVVVGALYGVSEMRQTYLGEFKDQLGLTDELVKSSFLFFWLNLAVFVTAIILAYLTHDPVPGFQRIRDDSMTAQLRVEKLEREQTKAFEEIGLERAAAISSAKSSYRRALSDITHTKGKYDQLLREGQEHESRCLDRLGQAVSIYRHENMSVRSDRKVPKSFNKMLSFPLSLTSIPEKLPNDQDRAPESEASRV